MSDLGKRIQQLRNERELSQTQLAEKVGVSYAQIGRYETKGAQPPASVLQKIAEALNTSVDFLIYGPSDEKAKASLNDDNLLRQFQQLEKMDSEDKKIIVELIDAFITKKQVQKLA